MQTAESLWGVSTQGLTPTKRLAQGRVVKSVLARVALRWARLLLLVVETVGA